MTRQTILEKALTLFTEKGYIGASMGDIAKAVGIKKASLYSHFDGKESIFEAVFNQILDEYVAFIHKLTAEDRRQNAVESLDMIFKTFIRYCKHNPMMYFWDRYYYYPPEFLKDYIMEKTDETNTIFIDAITAVFAKGIQDGEIRGYYHRKLALAYYYLLIGLSMSVKLYTDEELEREMADALDGFLSGIRNEKE